MVFAARRVVVDRYAAGSQPAAQSRIGATRTLTSGKTAGGCAVTDRFVAAGAVEEAARLGRFWSAIQPADYAARSDSFHFFEKLGDALVTGPTENNVRDIRLLVAW